jgi:hypothetical protein
LDSGEDHAAGGALQGGAQIGAAVGLLWGLADQVPAHREGGEELIVEVVAVRDDDDGRVGHRWVAYQLADVEGHQQALA